MAVAVRDDGAMAATRRPMAKSGGHPEREGRDVAERVGGERDVERNAADDDEQDEAR